MAVEWRTVEVFPNRGFAEIGGSALASAGIPFRVVADDAGAMGLPLSLRQQGAELQVPAEDAEEATALLEVGEQPPSRTAHRAGLSMHVGPMVRVVVAALVLAVVVVVVLSSLP